MVPEPLPGRARRSPSCPYGPHRLLRNSLVRFGGGSLPTSGDAERFLSDSPPELAGHVAKLLA
jgi:hypothetical protein